LRDRRQKLESRSQETEERRPAPRSPDKPRKGFGVKIRGKPRPPKNKQRKFHHPDIEIGAGGDAENTEDGRRAGRTRKGFGASLIIGARAAGGWAGRTRKGFGASPPH